METENTFEFGYKRYEKLCEKLIDITPLMINLSVSNILELQKKFPRSLKLSVKQIDRMKSELRKGAKFPPIIVEVDDKRSFVTVVDGMHRIIAYNDENIKKTNCMFVKRISE